MGENNTMGNTHVYKDEILNSLIDDPTRSIREIAKKLKTYRQKVWRKKKKLEEEQIIWGYTAVVDESKLNNVSYLILLKTKPMSEELVKLLIKRLGQHEPYKQGIRIKNFCYVNGEYDWVERFSAPDHATARKYYDTIRLLYDEYLLEKPVMIDVNFCLVIEGKNNPSLDKLYNFIPNMTQ